GRPDLQIGCHLGHVRVAHDDVKAPVPLGVGVRLVAGVDDRARRRGGAGDLLADVLGPLRQAVMEPARRLEHLARPGEDLPGHEEGDEGLGESLERDVTRDQIVLVAAVGVTGRVGVVLEEQDVAGDPVLPQALLGLVQEVLDDALAGLVVDDQLGHVVALGRRVLGMEPGVEVEPGAVFQEDVRVAGAGNDLLEQVTGDVVGRQATLTVEGAGEAVLVLEAEDPTLHGPVLPKRNTAYLAVPRSCPNASSGMRRNLRRAFVRSSTATSRARSVSVLFCVTVRARTPSCSASPSSMPSLW